MKEHSSAVAPNDAYKNGKAANYFDHHQSRLRNRLTHYREQSVLKKALRLAGRPTSALDLPCGTGRFWRCFYDTGVEKLITGDASPSMLSVAKQRLELEGWAHTLTFANAFELPFQNEAVEFSACLRFYHHIARPQDRHKLLKELARVSSGYIAISLWVDGNLAGNRRMKKQNVDESIPGYGPRICRAQAEIEQEFDDAGLLIIESFDIWPIVGMWRLYLLRINPHAGELVKDVQRRGRKGYSAIRLVSSDAGRVFVKSQKDYTCRPAWRCFRKTPTLTREYRALHAFKALHIGVPDIVYFKEENTMAELALAEIRNAVPLDQALEDTAKVRTVLETLANLVGKIHRHGWTHGSLRPEHILVRGTDIFLIDLEKARLGGKNRQRQDVDRLCRSIDFVLKDDIDFFKQVYTVSLTRQETTEESGVN